MGLTVAQRPALVLHLLTQGFTQGSGSPVSDICKISGIQSDHLYYTKDVQVCSLSSNIFRYVL